MSDQPKPLFALCEEWREQDHGEEYVEDLKAALKAWDAKLATYGGSTNDLQEFTIHKTYAAVREQILGLPKGTGE